jgi:hypothetical protein
VEVKGPELTLEDPKDKAKLPFKIELKEHSIRHGEATLQYALSLNEREFHLVGTATLEASPSGNSKEDVLIERIEFSFPEAIKANIEAVEPFDLRGDAPRQIGLPELNGVFRTWPMTSGAGGAGRFELGRAAQGPVQCSVLAMPVVGLILDDPGTSTQSYPDSAHELAVAADPYWGSFIQAQAAKENGLASTSITVRSTYTGAIIPVRSERRTLALEFHRKGTDGTLRTFYRTIPEIKPAASWTQGVQLVYYDYLSLKGEGWFKDVQAMADHIPPSYRGHVALCLHGWYDYFQHYAYDDASRRLLDNWTAFPGTYKVPMSVADMHRRIKFAKDLGFHVLLYFADGTNSDSGAPNFHRNYVLRDQTGNTFGGWKGPDSIGNPLKMDPSVPALRQWHHHYLKALLDEYAKDVDGFVWDETFYIPTNFVSYTGPEPAYADRAMMTLVSELTQEVQSYHFLNPNLVFLAADGGETSYALVADGTYEDTSMQEHKIGPSLFSNYRNCLWYCNWFPLHEAGNQMLCDKYGMAQGLSDGWGDNCGPAQMPLAPLNTVVKRFMQNVDTNRQRVRYFDP